MLLFIYCFIIFHKLLINTEYVYRQCTKWEMDMGLGIYNVN